MNQIKSALTIAGTDPTGGAGIHADLKTFQEREVFGMSVITSAVAQNTMGVQAVEHMPIAFIEEQLKSVFDDIVPDAIKTGMVSSVDMMQLIATYIKDRPSVPYILDPVMVATSGDALMEEASREVLKDELLPLAKVVTPNVPEAEILINSKIETIDDMKRAARLIVDGKGATSAVVKGGHLGEDVTDVFYDGHEMVLLSGERYETNHTHGTGCTFAAAITAELAKGTELKQAVELAKEFVSAALQYPLGIGKGNGPTNHWGYRLKGLPNQKGSDM
ncbi:hydroxymethylpyrimidine/phosphomethylpyrimidine kinase [Pelagirhabdus alkalitolerans]|uniref:Hydroxymethylpyrimidine/phosphomethylpyrimidine kinase n=1 Tax=Pelagirhabdus alkalitolerans TaxID=1612202 RepID=A0A1G6JKM3_9BACI|nr:bifunctional hydroxymethylpyrimidine kinase/phosphomethylpyrimidine kinase [Pelagirhabdus alkalitolerans]SDC19322.1 hydroxymethylpyrimidine/phosphomethylpyrimidine kinase [Pelagirhabdus alkalitolerans]